uniref:Major facilitator superfamily (MFS) profile domain-containing protein n=1 Tax=Globodera rostochiensis TaxID=31243 RepID=A0A914I1U5_GLORO
MASANERAEKAAVSGKGYERSQLAIAALMILSNLFVGITFACIVPFFPIEARAKGLSTSQVGLVIGILQLSTFFISPVFGKYMVILGINRAFIGGLCLTSLCTMALGLSPYLPFGTPFFVGVLLLRVGQSIGNASYSTSAWALIGHLFPERIVMFTALLEVAYGLGFTIGPVLGSILFEIGGFGLPLYSVGASFAFVLVPSAILFRSKYITATGNQDVQSGTAEAEEVPRVLQLLAIPDLFLSVTSMFLNSVCWYFYEPSLTDYMATFNLKWSPSILSGFLMSIVSVVYIISAPVWSFFVERYLSDQMRPMMLMVSVGMAIVTLLMGPSPLLGLPRSFLIITFAFGLLGFVAGIAYVPVFKWCIDAAKKKGLNGTSPGICGCVSSFIQSALSLGAFVATSLGGLSAQNLGFAWTATLVAGIQLIFIAVQIVYWLLQSRKSQRNDSIHPTA